MKKLFFLLTTCLFLQIPAFCIDTYKSGDTLYVWARHGLSLRTAASAGAPRQVIIPYGSKVVVLDSLRVKPFQLKEYPGVALRGHWSKVRFGTTEGFVFDAYLSRYPARRILDSKHQELEDFTVYAAREFGLVKKEKLELESNKACTDCRDYREIYTFRKGVVYELQHGSNDGGWEVPNYLLPGLSFEEAFIGFMYNVDVYLFAPRQNKPGASTEATGFILRESAGRKELIWDTCTYTFEKKEKKMRIWVLCSC